MENDKFKFGVPVDLIKGTNSKGEERLLFKGRASTGHKDSQGENLNVNGMDLSEFKIVNWNHLKTPDAILGEPTKAVVSGGNLDIEGELYPEVPHAVSTHNLMKALKKRGKQLYLSVEGKVTERGSNDKNNPLYNKILKSKITGVAITPNPINSNTFCELIEKGYTDINEWSYDEEVEELVKSASTEVIEDETEKAMTAAAGEGVTSKESVETPTDKKPLKSLEESSHIVLKKSDIYEKIYDKCPEITVEKAKSVYSLIEKINNMTPTDNKEITDETISKAFEILDLASDTISKAEKGEGTKAEEKKDEEDEKEMVSKAKDKYKVMKAAGTDAKSIKENLMKKGYGEKVIEKAMKEDEGTQVAKAEGISKSEIADIIKAELSPIHEKFSAVTTILKKQVEENTELKKSFETVSEQNELLKTEIDKLGKTPGTPKSIQTKTYSDKFQKSESGSQAQKFNLKDKTDRNALKASIIEKSGLNQGENYDKELVSIAQELELTGTLTKSSSIQRLQACGYELVAE